MPHLRALEADIAHLGEAFNHNAQLFQHGLTIAEMRLRILERAMHDQLRGRLLTHEVEGDMEIDFEAYGREFAMCMLMSEFATWGRGLMESAAKRDAAGIIHPGVDDSVLIFGGGQ